MVRFDGASDGHSLEHLYLMKEQFFVMIARGTIAGVHCSSVTPDYLPYEEANESLILKQSSDSLRLIMLSRIWAM